MLRELTFFLPRMRDAVEGGWVVRGHNPSGRRRRWLGAGGFGWVRVVVGLQTELGWG